MLKFFSSDLAIEITDSASLNHGYSVLRGLIDKISSFHAWNCAPDDAEMVKTLNTMAIAYLSAAALKERIRHRCQVF
jgi:hypothetical protein